MSFDLTSGKLRPESLLRAKSFPAVNTAATFTIAANTERRNRLVRVYWSYNAAPTGGRLTITIGGVVEYDFDITAAGPNSVEMSGAISAVNATIVVTLAAAGAAVTGKLTGEYYVI